jgi:predicted HicB family RNase H-like nuclease
VQLTIQSQNDLCQNEVLNDYTVKCRANLHPPANNLKKKLMAKRFKKLVHSKTDR